MQPSSAEHQSGAYRSNGTTWCCPVIQPRLTVSCTLGHSSFSRAQSHARLIGFNVWYALGAFGVVMVTCLIFTWTVTLRP